jgi:methylase of polypeptide subunit release factors
MMLAQCTVRPEVGSALDIGTGCGVQAFQLAQHCDRVVATDLSPRCLEFARFNADLNRLDVELLRGDLFEPVGEQRFDLVVSNPPFVIGSPRAAHHMYRDYEGSGDAVCQRLVSKVDRHLTVGGWCQLLANWEITDTDDWSRHARAWVSSTDLDAWVIQRDVQDPAQYVETWLRDAGAHTAPEYHELYRKWLDTLREREVRAVGFGVITLRKGGRDHPIRRFQHAPQDWVQPVAPEIERWFAVKDWLAADPSGMLGALLTLGPDVVLEQHAWASDAPVAVLRRTGGMQWSGPVDAFGVDVLAGLDGEKTAADVVLKVAISHGIAPETALEQAIPVLARLMEEGFVRRGT